MAHYKLGDKSKAVCEACESVVNTTFVIRDVPFDDGIGIAKSILVAVCDSCNDIVAIPSNSVDLLVKMRKLAELNNNQKGNIL